MNVSASLWKGGAPPATLPPLPEVPNNGRGRVVADIPHKSPVLVQTKLGEIPRDYHSYSSYVDRHYTACDEGACTTHGSEVWRGLPVVDSAGRPQVEDVVKHIDAAPRSMLLGGALWGAIGAAGGAAAGTLVGLFAGFPLVTCAAVGGALGATIGGGLGARDASQDRIKLEWQEKPIQDLRLAGYYHTVSERTRQECRWEGWGDNRHYVCHTVNDGWDHDFRADVQGAPIGTYWEPVVTHYRA